MQTSSDAVLEPRDRLTQIVVQNAQLSRVLSLAMVAMLGNQWGSRIGEQLLRKLSSSLSHVTLDVSLTALLGTIIHENS